MSTTVYLNGKFLTRPLTGVQRSAFELVNSLDNLIGEKHIGNDYNFILLYPGKPLALQPFKYIKCVNKGILTGSLWEQMELPLYTFNSLLVSLCSISTLFKKKQIVLVHDASFFVNKDFFSFSFRTWYKFAIPFLGKIVNQIVTVSNFSKSELSKYGKINPDKIAVVYNSPEHILKVGEPSGGFVKTVESLKPYCLAVSNMGANKNFAGLSTAIDKINFSNYHMLIAGARLRTLKYAAPTNRATYLGYVTDEELKYLYKNASLFIFPSFYEGFGIPPLEAMILGCPVIASNTSAIPEVLDDACDYFNPFDPQDMAIKIDSLLNNPSRLNDLKILGQKRASVYSWRNSGKKLFALIQRHSG